MKIQLIDFGGRSPERAHANDAGADVFSPKDAVIRPGDICKLPLGFGLKIPDFTFENWKERGTGAFGSTGR